MHVVAHCRTGFEAECAAELADVARQARLAFTGDAVAPSAIVAGTLEPPDRQRFVATLKRNDPIFARSLFVGADAQSLPTTDRISPLLEIASTLTPPFDAIWLETPDTNEGKTLSPFTRRLQPLLEQAARERGVLAAQARPRKLHVLFATRELAYVGTSEPGMGARWPMGIPRLRMPPGAPSRSTLKLVEALITFLGESESDVLRPAMRAVDLGAAPGGWTWQLARRGLRVTAIDNGPLKGDIAQDSLVTHLHTDGLTYRPRRPVDWMVCDIVDKPSRIASLVARWIADGDARRSIFNLKLPMKRRYEAVLDCRAIIDETLRQAGVPFVLRMKQLYHDREEVTGYLERVG